MKFSMKDSLGQQNIDIEAVLENMQRFTVETPSWGYGDSGTRFKVFRWPGAASTLREKLNDAAQAQRVTGICPSVVIHIPWDKEDDWQAVKEYASALGLRVGTVNPNLFQDDAYRFGSLCHFDKRMRQRAIEHVIECIQIAQEVGSDIISLWLADGTNYPGQDDLRRRHRLLDSLQTIYAALPAGMRLLIEYKFFEPAFYSTDLPDWGTSLLMAQKLGSQAEVLVDTGHHPQGTNIAQIVAQLLDEGRLGGFHFNDRRYADDDLIVGAGSEGNANAGRIAYMIDQSHNIEPKIEAMIQSVVNIQTAYAKALLVDRAALCEAQEAYENEASVRAAFEQAALAFGGIDVIVNNAGLASSAPITETTLSEWNKNWNVLATGYFLVAREGFRLMEAQGRGGNLVFVASKNALVAGKNAAAYSTAKAAEAHLARRLAEEGGQFGIRVNTVNPDAVLAGSRIWDSTWRQERAATYGVAPDQLEEVYRKRTTLGVNILPEDIGEAVAFFASPTRSLKSTGNILNVDGGVAAAYPR